MAKYLVAVWIILVIIMLFLFAGLAPELIANAPEGYEFIMTALLVVILFVAIISAYAYTKTDKELNQL